MRCEHDGMMVVRADLCDRLDRLQRTAERMTIRDLVQGIARDPHDRRRLRPRSRSSASPTPSSARSAPQPRGCPAGLYFDRLRDAIGCERLDEAASEALLASVSIRFEV